MCFRSQEAFRAIDLDATTAFARKCKNGGVKHFQLVSSTRADSSSMFLYLQTKGEAEDNVRNRELRNILCFADLRSFVAGESDGV